MNKKLILTSFLLMAGSLASMESLKFLKTVTPAQLERQATAGVDNLTQFNEYARRIKLEIALQEINLHVDNQEPETSNVSRLKDHLLATCSRAELYDAIKSGNYEASKKILANLPVRSLQNNTDGLLHMVCFGNWHEDEKKTIEILNLLLQAKLDINHKLESPLSLLTGTPLDVALGKNNRTFLTPRLKAPISIQTFLKEKGAQCSDEQAQYYQDELNECNGACEDDMP